MDGKMSTDARSLMPYPIPYIIMDDIDMIHCIDCSNNFNFITSEPYKQVLSI